MRPPLLLLPALLLLGSVPPALAQTEEAKLEDLAGGQDDRFGKATAVDAGTAVVGAPRHAVGGIDSGAVYVYVASGGAFALQQVLVPSDAAAGQFFGTSVALDGDTIVVGAHFDQENGFNAGAAYVFTRSGSTWTEEAKLSPTSAADFDWFGHAVSVDGDRALVGAPFKNVVAFGSGSAFVFVRSAGVWTEEWQLAPNDPAGDDLFGWSVALSGDSAAVGSKLEDPGVQDAGSAYVFTRAGAVWSQQAKLAASDAGLDHELGSAVALDGDVLVAGSIREGTNGVDAGAAYVFARNAGVWSEAAKLLASDGGAGDLFGNSVAVAGEVAVVGAFHPDGLGTGTGAAYVYAFDGAGWNELAKLVGSDSAVDDWLGHGVATDGTHALVGASEHAGRGAAYVFALGGGFQSYCFGDGSASACPCANESAPGAGQGCANSSGDGGRLVPSGSTSVGADDLAFGAEELLPGQPALLFAGQNAVQGGDGAPFGDGLRCAGQGVVRLGVRVPDAQGMASWGPGLAAQGGWGAGDTRYFQTWYRDPAGSPCGANFNLSQGVAAAFVD